LSCQKSEGSEVSAELEFLNQQNLILSIENKALKQRKKKMASRLGSDNDTDNNKGSMWVLEKKLDQPMDEEAARLKKYVQRKIRRSMHAMIEAPKSQTMIRKYCVDMTMTDNNISTTSSCKQTKG
ncbi:hypothetical protein S83_059529, partial [Arachis hypogaea]